MTRMKAHVLETFELLSFSELIFMNSSIFYLILQKRKINECRIQTIWIGFSNRNLCQKFCLMDQMDRYEAGSARFHSSSESDRFACMHKTTDTTIYRFNDYELNLNEHPGNTPAWHAYYVRADSSSSINCR
jgi:hypothetical protein